MGEDPYLASRMVVPYVQKLQEQGVAACVKHYALNNNEVNRHTTNVVIDDRTLYEIYLPAFKAAVQEGGAWSIMAAYNLYGDRHLCHNDRLLNKILKEEWGFDGAVISDWGGTHDTREAIEGGLDLEFGSWTNGLSNGASNAYDNYYLARPLSRPYQQRRNRHCRAGRQGPPRAATYITHSNGIRQGRRSYAARRTTMPHAR